MNSGPRPPAHINCRSVTIPRLKGMKPFGRTTYNAWFATLTPAMQKEILGATRSALWSRGSLKLDRFTDDAEHILTLAELRQRDASAFASAGLN